MFTRFLVFAMEKHIKKSSKFDNSKNGKESKNARKDHKEKSNLKAERNKEKAKAGKVGLFNSDYVLENINKLSSG